MLLCLLAFLVLRVRQIAHSFSPIAHTASQLHARTMAMTARVSSSSSAAALLADLCSSPHHHARSPNSAYPARTPVPDNKLDWDTAWPEYAPKDFTLERTIQRSPDNADAKKIPDLAKRVSHAGPMRLDPASGRPLNPRGRTGLAGRGKLYRWGPNQAADPIVSRVAPDSASSSSSSSSSSSPSLEIVVIKRGDTGAWALPGGMVDSGEQAEAAAKREFGEEALGIQPEKEGSKAEQTEKDRQSKARAVLDKIFPPSAAKTDAVERVYAGYIDDPRNTDNAWMESCVFHAHLSAADAAALTPLLQAGDDAKEVRWMKVSADDAESEEMKKLYASHKLIVQLAVQRWKDKQSSGGN